MKRIPLSGKKGTGTATEHGDVRSPDDMLEMTAAEYRPLRTPITEAGAAIAILADMYDGIMQKEKEEEQYISAVFGLIWRDDEADADRWTDDLNEMFDSDPGTDVGAIGATMIATVHAVQAMKLFKNGETQLAWTHAIDSMKLATHLQDSYFANRDRPNISRLGSAARHAENRAMKAQAIQHYLLNIENYSSKDAAAERIAGTVVPVKFRTVRDWLIGLQSPGRP